MNAKRHSSTKPNHTAERLPPNAAALNHVQSTSHAPPATASVNQGVSIFARLVGSASGDRGTLGELLEFVREGVPLIKKLPETVGRLTALVNLAIVRCSVYINRGI